MHSHRVCPALGSASSHESTLPVSTAVKAVTHVTARINGSRIHLPTFVFLPNLYLNLSFLKLHLQK